jgi:hypothetical protein
MRMELYLLRPISGQEEEGAWDPWYDKCFGFVIRAESEETARKLADTNAGDENLKDTHPWLDSKQSTCTPLHADSDNKEEIIIRDFNAA